MVISEEKLRQYMRRLLLARLRLLCSNGFYGLLLMHVKFGITEKVKHCGCGGEYIGLNPEFLDQISDSELDYVLMHEILHLVLRHAERLGELEPERFNIACDIVVDSNILRSNGMDERSITLRACGGVQPHTAPDGREGYLFTAEELYALIPPPSGSTIKGPGSKKSDCSSDSKRTSSGGKSMSNSGKSMSSGGRDKSSSRRSESRKEKTSGGDSEDDTVGDNGKGSSDGSDSGSSSSGDGGEGSSWLYGRAEKTAMRASDTVGRWDDHGYVGDIEPDDALREVWVKRFKDACEVISVRDPSDGRGLLPAFARRMLEELRRPQTDWRAVLNDFVQEEITDYSFMPPDYRFGDSPFFLPAYSEKDDLVKDILFMIDTSGSVSDKQMTAAYSEIKGAIDQFNGRLQGWLGFFDAAIVEPQPFEDEEEFRAIRPAGGGGTDFQIIFEYVAQHMLDNPPVSIVILTDGFAPFPQEELAGGIPTLWLLNNKQVQPPWGKVARIKAEETAV